MQLHFKFYFPCLCLPVVRSTDTIFFKKRKHFKDTQFCRYLFLRVQIFANAEGQNYIAGSMVDTGPSVAGGGREWDSKIIINFIQTF